MYDSVPVLSSRDSPTKDSINPKTTYVYILLTKPFFDKRESEPPSLHQGDPHNRAKTSSVQQ